MKYRLFIVFLAVAFLVSCSSKLSTSTASSVIKSGLKLSDKDNIKILGIAKESKGTAIVKLLLNEKALSVKLRKYDQGWQLEEIQNEMGTWIPAATVVNILDESSKIKQAMAEISTIATVLADYITDNLTLLPRSGAFDENSQFYKSLCPLYVKELPTKDPWGNNYLVYCGKSIDGQYGLKGSAIDDYLIVSYGKDREMDTWNYDPSDPISGIYNDTNGIKDLVNLNGSFIRGPRSRMEN